MADNSLAPTFELFDIAIGMIETKTRRENPDATKTEIDLAVTAWLAARPGAPNGDVAGDVRVRQ